MKKGTLCTLSLIALVGGVLTYEFKPSVFYALGGVFAQDEAPAAPEGKKKKKKKAVKQPTGPMPGFNGSSLKGEEWADNSTLQQRLGDAIVSKVDGTDEAALKSFITKPENRLLLAQWHVANREGAINADALAKTRETITRDIEAREQKLAELKAKPASKEVREAISAETEALRNRRKELKYSLNASHLAASGAAFLSKATNNLEWMEQLAWSGECDNPGRALGIMQAIVERHPDATHNRVKREIAAAVAIEWAKSGWNFDKALARADYFIENWEEGRLHPIFDDLPFWQRRMVCGAKGNNGYGEAESLQWQLDNVSLPTEQYSGCCWQCAYRLNNLFGDSIHGPMYYNPYAEVHGSNTALRTYDVGGVCGSLSHYGAFAAIANGVPAMTAGEPGHCAYIVRSNGKWQPGYSLSWKRGLHWTVWNNNHKFATLHMATELFSPEQEAKTRLADAQLTLARLHASRGEADKANALFTAALKTQPLSYAGWREYANFLKANKPQDAAAWKALNSAMCETLVPRFPEVAAELMKGCVYPNVKALKLSGAEMMAFFGAFWEAVDGMGPDRWDIESLCGAQADTLKQMGGKVENCNLALYKMALSDCAGKAPYAPVILSWGNGMAAKLSPEMQQKFFQATIEGLSKGGSMEAGARDKMLGQALAGAEKMRDRSSFQAIGRMLSDNYKKNRLPKWEPFPGKLASQGGLMYASSSAHDDPPAHWGVLEPTGGRFHTASEVNPWVVVEMPKMIYITGVVAISTAGHNNRRLRDMKVQYSESGKDDDWHEAGAFPAPSTREVNRLDLRESKPRARFIRIIRGGGKDVFHLNGIFVYGEQAA